MRNGGLCQFDGDLVLCEYTTSARYAPTIYVPIAAVALDIYSRISGNTILPIRITPAQYIDILYCKGHLPRGGQSSPWKVTQCEKPYFWM